MSNKNVKRKGLRREETPANPTKPSKKRTASAIHENDVAAGDTPLEPLQGKWSLFIAPGQMAFIGHDVQLHLILKNVGPGMVGIPNRQGDLEKITPGALLVRTIIGDIIIQSMEEKPALVAMEFLPWSR